jgi:transposase InsO family protein
VAAQGVSCPRAAAQLQIVPRTLRWWRQGPRSSVEVAASENGATLRPGRLAPLFHFAYRGRPPLEVDVPTRNQIYGFLHHVTGPAIGLPALQALYRNVPRCILEDLLSRYRCVWRERYAQHGFELTWHYAGTVWAMDFTEPLHPIDGVFPYLLAIRDLASYCQLAWRPVRGETAEDVLPVLRELFTEFGPPLVLKSDNGPAFIAAPLHELLGEALVAQLFSPIRRPQYNGALERNNGVLKVYTDQHALSAGHPFRWTAEDVDHAQQLANTISRPWGALGPSPEQAWQARVPISFEERQTFLTALDGHRQWAAGELALDLAADLSVADRARLDRLAISSTLQDLGYLTQQRSGHVERPQRLSRDALARRVAKFREQTPIADEPVTEAPTAEPPLTEAPLMEAPVVETPDVETSVDQASVTKPLVGQTPVREPQVAENPTPPRSPESVSQPRQDLAASQLAESASSDILLAGSTTASAPPSFAQASPSAHGGQTITSWLRRSIAPLVSFFKTADIPQ